MKWLVLCGLSTLATGGSAIFRMPRVHRLHFNVLVGISLILFSRSLCGTTISRRPLIPVEETRSVIANSVINDTGHFKKSSLSQVQFLPFEGRNLIRGNGSWVCATCHDSNLIFTIFSDAQVTKNGSRYSLRIPVQSSILHRGRDARINEELLTPTAPTVLLDDEGSNSRVVPPIIDADDDACDTCDKPVNLDESDSITNETSEKNTVEAFDQLITLMVSSVPPINDSDNVSWLEEDLDRTITLMSSSVAPVNDSSVWMDDGVIDQIVILMASSVVPLNNASASMDIDSSDHDVILMTSCTIEEPSRTKLPAQKRIKDNSDMNLLNIDFDFDGEGDDNGPEEEDDDYKGEVGGGVEYNNIVVADDNAGSVQGQGQGDSNEVNDSSWATGGGSMATIIGTDDNITVVAPAGIANISSSNAHHHDTGSESSNTAASIPIPAVSSQPQPLFGCGADFDSDNSSTADAASPNNNMSSEATVSSLGVDGAAGDKDAAIAIIIGTVSIEDDVSSTVATVAEDEVAYTSSSYSTLKATTVTTDKISSVAEDIELLKSAAAELPNSYSSTVPASDATKEAEPIAAAEIITTSDNDIDTNIEEEQNKNKSEDTAAAVDVVNNNSSTNSSSSLEQHPPPPSNTTSSTAAIPILEPPPAPPSSMSYLMLGLISIVFFSMGCIATLLGYFSYNKIYQRWQAYVTSSLDSLEDKAISLMSIGEMREAVDTLDKAITYAGRVREKNHFDVAGFKHLQAKAQMALGNYGIAESLLVDVSEVYAPLGEEDAHIGRVVEDLGVSTYNLKKYPEAYTYFSKALSIYQRELTVVVLGDKDGDDENLFGDNDEKLFASFNHGELYRQRLSESALMQARTTLAAAGNENDNSPSGSAAAAALTLHVSSMYPDPSLSSFRSPTASSSSRRRNMLQETVHSTAEATRISPYHNSSSFNTPGTGLARGIRWGSQSTGQVQRRQQQLRKQQQEQQQQSQPSAIRFAADHHSSTITNQSTLLASSVSLPAPAFNLDEDSSDIDIEQDNNNIFSSLPEQQQQFPPLHQPTATPTTKTAANPTTILGGRGGERGETTATHPTTIFGGRGGERGERRRRSSRTLAPGGGTNISSIGTSCVESEPESKLKLEENKPDEPAEEEEEEGKEKEEEYGAALKDLEALLTPSKAAASLSVSDGGMGASHAAGMSISQRSRSKLRNKILRNTGIPSELSDRKFFGRNNNHTEGEGAAAAASLSSPTTGRRTTTSTTTAANTTSNALSMQQQQQQGRIDEAAALRVDIARMHFQIGQVLFDVGRFGDAGRMFNTALEMFENIVITMGEESEFGNECVALAVLANTRIAELDVLLPQESDQQSFDSVSSLSSINNNGVAGTGAGATDTWGAGQAEITI